MDAHECRYYTTFLNDDSFRMRKLTVETSERVYTGYLVQWDFYDDVAVLNEIEDTEYRETIQGTVKDKTYKQVIVPYTAVIEAKLEWKKSTIEAKRTPEEIDRLEDAYEKYTEARRNHDPAGAIEPLTLLRDAGLEPRPGANLWL